MEHVPRETSAVKALTPALLRLLPDLEPEICSIFEKHFALLCRWNSKYNITRITDPGDAALLHYVDSLLPLRSLATPRSVVDIGSGTGLPGIAAAALWPTTLVTLVDSSGKKTSFLRAVRAQLPEVRLEVLQGRCESIPEQHAGLVLIRATFQWPEIPGMVARHLSSQGRLLAYLGQEAPSDSEWSRVVQSSNLIKAELQKYNLPGNQHVRHAAFAHKE
jgi:16S rRNA (guanine527-N7)-methyltransferase